MSRAVIILVFLISVIAGATFLTIKFYTGPSVNLQEIANVGSSELNSKKIQIKILNKDKLPPSYKISAAFHVAYNRKNRTGDMFYQTMPVQVPAENNGQDVFFDIPIKDSSGAEMRYLVLNATACEMPGGTCNVEKKIFYYNSNWMIDDKPEIIEVDFRPKNEDANLCQSGLYNEGKFKLNLPAKEKAFIAGFRPSLSGSSVNETVKLSIFRPLFTLPLPKGVKEGSFKILRSQVAPSAYFGPVEYRLVNCSEENYIDFKVCIFGKDFFKNSKPLISSQNEFLGCGAQGFELKEK